MFNKEVEVTSWQYTGVGSEGFKAVVDSLKGAFGSETGVVHVSLVQKESRGWYSTELQIERSRGKGLDPQMLTLKEGNWLVYEGQLLDGFKVLSNRQHAQLQAGRKATWGDSGLDNFEDFNSDSLYSGINSNWAINMFLNQYLDGALVDGYPDNALHLEGLEINGVVGAMRHCQDNGILGSPKELFNWATKEIGLLLRERVEMGLEDGGSDLKEDQKAMMEKYLTTLPEGKSVYS